MLDLNHLLDCIEAQGVMKSYNQDTIETSALTDCDFTFRVLILTASNDYYVGCLDVSTASLHGCVGRKSYNRIPIELKIDRKWIYFEILNSSIGRGGMLEIMVYAANRLSPTDGTVWKLSRKLCGDLHQGTTCSLACQYIKD